ncbi:MAG: transcriptional repressor LexA [candidate division Zixibacteria bacterium]|nr:transcriptional repressor LexA [candidate division Zixibacteria bacterium]
MREPLTDRQRKILEYIERRITEDRQPPTIREIGSQFGITSTNGVRSHLEVLIRKGYLKKEGFVSRGLELTRGLAGSVRHIPLVGAVPAGSPIDAAENVESEFALDKGFLPGGETFSLRVKGDSMHDAGILDGDFVLVLKQDTARSGDIVVAIINGEATVKRYFPEGGRIRLQPENDQYQPIVVEKKSGEFRLAGKVIGLLRRFK